MRSQFLAVALTTTCLAAAPIYADISPEEAWQSYQDMMSSMGMAPTAEVSRDGDTLVVRNMIYSMQMPAPGMSNVSTAPEVRFQERSGGTVALWFTEPVTTIVTAPLDPELPDETLETRSSISYEGEVVISGTAEDQLYTLDGNSMVMSTAPMVIDGKTMQPGLTATLSGVSGTYSLRKEDDALASEMDIKGSSLIYDIDPVEGEDGTVEIGFEAHDLAMTGTVNMSAQMSEDVLAALFGHSDLDIQMGLGTSAMSLKVLGDTPESNMDVQANTGGSTLDISVHGGTVGYDATANDINLTLAGAQIPGGAAEITLKSYSAGFLFPLAASDAPQSFEGKIGLEALSLPDIAWMIADPTGQLPHDPATFRLSLNGTLTSGIDLFDAKALSALEGGETNLPIDLKTLNLAEIYLALAGASISGEGAGYVLDKEPATPGGLPPFAGTLSLDLIGVTDLIDKLSSTGILPPEQAMSAQMMLGLFARPGDTPGELVSEIEMLEDGSILANGQPLPF
ncbi:hypothetical protein [Celeribacter neptunius]|uniref:DUF2125 domain-containing protein n=1 Tax=Celeribacter neptunius TaxID=588602 RepID=A0A1I3S4W1_9RHOB|nr:hypothetical protein [Celeribacter neptunius]SFJ52601.1 hypothetical protein SAMN04487991_2298 [Celeribacter neptunius]